MQQPRPVVDPVILGKCANYQKLIHRSGIAKELLLALMIVDMITTLVSGLVVAGTGNPQILTAATYTFDTALVLLPILIFSFIFCPTPRQYGPLLVVETNRLPESSCALASLKKQLIQEGVNAVAWKL
jgi:uncharacterized membrane protein